MRCVARPFAFCLVVLAPACSGLRASLKDGVLRKDGGEVALGPIPSEWQRIDVQGADVAFRDDAHEGSTLVDLRCNRRDDDVPLVALTNQLVMGTTEREIESQETIPLDRREALRTIMRAKLDGVPMRYGIYVLKKDGCVYDLVYVAPPGRFAEGAPDFDRFARGLQTRHGPRAGAGP